VAEETIERQTLYFVMQEVKLKMYREERIPTKCNNIDDLLSIPDVEY